MLSFEARRRSLKWRERSDDESEAGERPSTMDTKDQTIELKQEIWSSLPQDALESVILRLPLRSIVRIRAVCKGWDSAITSKVFSDLYSRVPYRWLLIFPRIEGSFDLAYDASSKSWFEIPLSFLPFESKVVATAEGLFCLVPKASNRKVWIVCNPISRSWKELPSPPGIFKLFFGRVGMLVDEDRKSFKIVWAGSKLVAENSEQFILMTEVYDSSLRFWGRGGSILLDAPLSPWKAMSGGTLYCLTSYRSLPYRVLAYDVKGAYWSELKAPMPEGLTLPLLVDHGDQLLMVGGVGQYGVTSEIGIWKLNSTGALWNEVGWMPSPYRDVLLNPPARRFMCIGQGNLLYFSNRKCQGILEHNLIEKSWQWIPLHQSIVNFHYYMLRGFYFQPRLHKWLHGQL